MDQWSLMNCMWWGDGERWVRVRPRFLVHEMVDVRLTDQGNNGRGEPSYLACLCIESQRIERQLEDGRDSCRVWGWGEKEIIMKERKDSVIYQRLFQGIRTPKPPITTIFNLYWQHRYY